MNALKGGKETFPPLEPPVLWAPEGQQSLPILRTQTPASVSLLCGIHLTSTSPLPGKNVHR